MNLKFWQKNEDKTGLAIQEIPPVGRSSKDEPRTLLQGIQGYSRFFDDLSPTVPYEYIRYLTRIVFINPTLKNALMNWKVLANSGHEIIVKSKTESRAAAAKEALNTLAYRVNPYGAGMDGLIDNLLLQVGITGANSIEGVVAKNRRELENIAIVPVESIRFRREGGNYIPHQRLSTGQEIPLNPLTYRYCAWEQMENNPYGIPPLLSALQAVLDQVDMDKNVRFIIKKFGILGLVSYILKPLKRKPNESESEYQSRLAGHLKKVSESLQDNFMNGLLVHYDDQSVEHHNTTGEARGANDLYMQNVHKLGSGTFTPLAFLGYSDSVTETFANVVYRIYVRLAENLRRPVKRSMESEQRLELLLKGIDVDWVSMAFNPVPDRDPQSTAQAAQINQKNAIERAEIGLIDPDGAAQEMGYEGWYDPERLYNRNSGGLGLFGSMQRSDKNIFRFKFNQELNRYEHHRPIVKILNHNNPGFANLGDGWEEVSRRIISYLNSLEEYSWEAKEAAVDRVLKFLADHKASDFASPEAFGRDVYNEVIHAYEGVFDSPAVARTLRDNVNPIYSFFRLEDRGGLPPGGDFQFRFNTIDQRALEFMEQTDGFYLSKFISNDRAHAGGVNYLTEQYLENGEAIFGRASPEAIDAFRSQFDNYLADRADHQVKTIIDSSVQRMRGYARTQQFADAGFAYKELVPRADACDICASLAERRVEISPSARQMEREVNMTPEQFENYLKSLSNENLQQRYLEGNLLVPIHPNCHCQERVVVE